MTTSETFNKIKPTRSLTISIPSDDQKSTTPDQNLAVLKKVTSQILEVNPYLVLTTQQKKQAGSSKKNGPVATAKRDLNDLMVQMQNRYQKMFMLSEFENSSEVTAMQFSQDSTQIFVGFRSGEVRPSSTLTKDRAPGHFPE